MVTGQSHCGKRAVGELNPGLSEDLEGTSSSPDGAVTSTHGSDDKGLDLKTAFDARPHGQRSFQPLGFSKASMETRSICLSDLICR